MNSFRLLDRRNGYLVAAFALVLSAIVPAIAAAAQLTERSIELSNSSADAKNVRYKVSFKATGEADAFVIDFCGDTPVYGQNCSTAGGFGFGTLTTPTAGFTVASLDTNTLRVTGDIQPGDISVEIEGINNPTAAGPLYARIATFDTEAHANSYVSNAANDGLVDNGSVALNITPTIGVSGSVLESMIFCVSKVQPGASCTNTTPPAVELGEDVGNGVIAMNANELYEGDVFTQISTNAAQGAIVSLKSNALGCGGLLRAGAPSECDIAPAQEDDVTANGGAKFGVKTGTVVDDADGVLRPYDAGSGAYYSDSVFKMRYVNNTNGVTSTYGDFLLDTDSKPANNKSMQLKFGAATTNSTPAGRYSAALSLIATGKF